jgi:selenide,water dikinase
VATTDFFMPWWTTLRLRRIAARPTPSATSTPWADAALRPRHRRHADRQLEPTPIGRILAGGASVCAAAGVPVAGGHSIDSVEPIYGLVALGLVHPDKVLTNRGGRAGDVLILTKPLGGRRG